MLIACQKIVQQRHASTICLTPTNSRPSTPNNHYHPSNIINIQRQTNNGYNQIGQSNVVQSPGHTHTLVHKVSFRINE